MDNFAFFVLTLLLSAGNDRTKLLAYKLFILGKNTPWSVVRKRTIPTEQLPFVGEVSAKFCE
jgi:hypothetical protein